MSRQVTEQQLEKFRVALARWDDEPPANVSPVLHQACKDAIVSQIEDLEQQLKAADLEP